MLLKQRLCQFLIIELALIQCFSQLCHCVLIIYGQLQTILKSKYRDYPAISLEDFGKEFRPAAMRFSPDERLIAFGSNTSVVLLDKKTEHVLFRFYCDSRVRSIEFSDDLQIVVAHSNETVTVFTDLLAKTTGTTPWNEVFGNH